MSVSTRTLAIAGALILVIIIAAAFMLQGGEEQPPETPAGGEEEAEETTPREEEGVETLTIKVDLTEWRIDLDTTSVKRGTKVVFEVVNSGNYVHALAVRSPGGEVIASTPNFGPGGSATLEVTFEEEGVYILYCPVGNHANLGMTTEFTVKG